MVVGKIAILLLLAWGRQYVVAEWMECRMFRSFAIHCSSMVEGWYDVLVFLGLAGGTHSCLGTSHRYEAEAQT